MSDKEIKTNEPLNKLLAALVDAKSIDSGSRTADFVITTDGVDRDGDIMDPMGMDTTHYEKNPTVLTFHNYNSFPVGKVINIKKTKKNVRATVEFVPAGVLPEAENELGDIGNMLSGLMFDVGQSSGLNINFNSVNEDASKILSEAATVAEQKINANLPNLPQDLPTGFRRESTN